MRRLRDVPECETYDNAQKAFDSYSEMKHNRGYVQEYERHLQDNLLDVVRMIADESWHPFGYHEEFIFDRKVRKLAKAPIGDHVLEAATIRPYEKALYDYSSWRAPAVKPGLGTHALFRFLRNELYRLPQREQLYFCAIDVHHYFPRMDHDILKGVVERKVKAGKLQRFLFKVIDSYPCGAPLGIKVAQIFGQLYLAPFDRKALRFFDIGDDSEKLQYWTRRYIEGCIVTARTPDDARELSRGTQYLARKFQRYVEEGIPLYLRFVDNILIRHADRQVVHIVKELCIMHLTRDWHCVVNTDYNVRPTYTGIRLVGYVFYDDHVLCARRNKQKLARRVRRLQKLGRSPEEIRVKLASRIGYVKHASCKHLFLSLGMEKSLGKIIKNRRVRAPFKDMNGKQKVPFSSIVTMPPEEGGKVHKILLEDYKILESKIDKQKVMVQVESAEGAPQMIEKSRPEMALAIRFKRILQTFTEDGEEKYVFEKQKDEEGNPTLYDAEFYAFTGSKVLIDQAKNDFTNDDLPCPTVIQQFKTPGGKTFVKFT